MQERLSTDKFVCRGNALDNVFRMLRELNLGLGTYYADPRIFVVFVVASRQTAG